MDVIQLAFHKSMFSTNSPFILQLNDDTKQIMSSFMLSISAVVMSYLQNPAPMNLPGSS